MGERGGPQVSRGGDFSVRSEVTSNGEVLDWSNVIWGPVISSCEILGQGNVVWHVGLSSLFQESIYPLGSL